MTHADIIDALGGIGPVAAALRRHRSRVTRWRVAGIPVFLWPDVVTAAQAMGRHDITIEALRVARDCKAPVPKLARGRRPTLRASA